MRWSRATRCSRSGRCARTLSSTVGTTCWRSRTTSRRCCWRSSTAFEQVQAAPGARTVDGGHGRIEVRTLHARAGQALSWLGWPGLQQMCRLVHQTRRRGRWQIQVHSKITSLPAELAGPAELLRLSRAHWAIENELHYVRDVTLGQDASRIRSGAAPQAMAAIRNLLVAVLQRDGLQNRAAGLRHFAWHPDQAAQALGVPCPPVVADSRVA